MNKTEIDLVNVPICDEMPRWLIEERGDVICFKCKIHQGWRLLNRLENLDWSKTWKTFRFNGVIKREEKEFYPDL